MKEAEIPESDEDGFKATNSRSKARIFQTIILATVIYGVYTAATVAEPIYMGVAMISILLVGLIVLRVVAAINSEGEEY